MRWSLWTIGLICFAISSLSYYFHNEFSDGREDQRVMSRVLSSQARLFRQQVENNIRGANVLLTDFEQRIEAKKSLADLWLREQAPDFFFILPKKENVKIFAPKMNSFIKSNSESLAKFLVKPEGSYFFAASAKELLLLKQKIRGVDYLAAYSMEKIFSKGSLNKVFLSWAALTDGTTLFRTDGKFVGVDSGNLRPIALSKRKLNKKIRAVSLEEYADIDGKEVYGAWSVLPHWQIVMGTEIPRQWNAASGPSMLLVLAAIFACIAFFLFGMLIRPTQVRVTSAKRKISELDGETQKIVQKARDSIEQAEKIKLQARDEVGYAERIRWIYETTENFLDEAVEARRAEQIWQLLAKNLSTMTLESPTLVMHYSPASCSLVAKSFRGNTDFHQGVTQYIKDSRLLLGDARKISLLEKTDVYQAWMKNIRKRCDLRNYDAYLMPFAASTGTRGLVIFFFTKEANKDGALERQRELWDVFAYRAAWLYDMKRRLLQSKRVAQQPKNLASPTDTIRGESHPN